MLNQFIIILPEIMLSAITLFMQIVGVFYNNHAKKIALYTIGLVLLVVCYLLYITSPHGFGQDEFNNFSLSNIAFSQSNFVSTFSLSFVTSPAISMFKILIIVLTVMSLLLYHDLMKISNEPLKMEFVTLILFSTLGLFIAISSRDFILLFCGLELQALSGYALASFNRNKVKSSEAGLKYFILGSLMSALMLLGISFLYGFSGSTKFIEIKTALNGELNIGLVVGSILVLANILFKLSVAPLHMWTPDVYEGAPISSVSYFAVVQKLAMLIVLINVVTNIIGDYTQISKELIKIVAILSMITGAYGAITQVSLKRLMAYSTILNIGYVLVGVCLNSQAGNYAAFLYMLTYVIGVIGFFACLIALFGNKCDEATFEDLKGIARQRKAIASAITIIMFSMIGLPPLAGFFGKYFIFYNAVANGEITLAIVGVLTSVVAAFYYLKIIKFMYFIEPTTDCTIIPTHKGLWLVTITSIAFILFFFIFLSPYLL